MPFSAFARCGNGFRCSSRKPLGKAIFDQFVESNGEVWASDGNLGAKWFADAMAIARCQSTLERAANQADPRTAHDLVRPLEKTYGILPEPDSTRASRREALYQAQRLTLGPVRPNVEAQLAAAIGSDFVAWVTTPAADDNDYPEKPWEVITYPMALPHNYKNALGIFHRVVRWKLIRLTGRVDHTVYVNDNVPLHQRVSWVHVAGDEGPLIGRKSRGYAEDGRVRLRPDRLIVEPGKLGQQEVVELATDVTETHLTAQFVRPHESGVLAMRAPWPFWVSIQKHSHVVVKQGRARDRRLRARVTRLLHKLLGATSTWDIVEENASPGASGPFLPGVGEPGITPIPTLNY